MTDWRFFLPFFFDGLGLLFEGGLVGVIGLTRWGFIPFLLLIAVVLGIGFRRWGRGRIDVEDNLLTAGSLFLGDLMIIEFDEIGQMFDDDFSIVFCLSAGVVVEPEYLGVGQLHQIFDLSKIHDVILAQVQFLKQIGFTWSLAHLEKSLRVLILFTLSDTTSRFGIFSINCRSSKSLPTG